MKNFIKSGNVLTAVAGVGGVASGALVFIGSLVGIANGAAAQDEEYEVTIGGVFSLPKTSAQAWALGDSIYWTGTEATNVAATGRKLIGAAAAPADNPSAKGEVRLNAGGAPSQLTATGTPAAGATNVAEVAIAVKDAAGNTVAKVHNIDVWLSDDADGQGLTGTTASGTVQAKSASGTVLDAMVAKKALRVQTLKTGIFTLEITDTAKTAFKVCASIGGSTVVLCTLATGNYG